jgi:hypothetical protein
MRIKDIIPESTRYRRMAPKTLDTIYAKQAYDRELAAVNAANAAQQRDIDNAKKREDYAQKKDAGTLPEDPIKVYSIHISRPYVRHWRKTHDRQWALEHAKLWRRIKQGVPANIKQQIYDDPSYQAAVIRIWDLADLVLKTYELPRPNFGVASGFSRLDRVGADKQDAVDAVIDFTDAIKKVLRKNNIDDTGRQLPPQR